MVATDTFKVRDFSLEHTKVEDIDFSVKYELTAMSNTSVHAMVAWFELHFTMGPVERILSTSPFMPKTKWKQTIFYLNQRLNIVDGDRIYGSLAMKRLKNDKSSNFKLSVHNDKEKVNIVQYYTLN